MTLAHWEDTPGEDLAQAVGAHWACLRRLAVTPGDPLHLDADDRVSVVWALDRDAVLARGPEDVERSVRAEGVLDLLLCATSAPRADPQAPPTPGPVVRTADLEPERLVDGQTSIVRWAVSDALGDVGLGVELVDVAPGRRSFPVLDLEEVSVVLRGTGRVVTGDAEPWVFRGCVVGQGERFTAGPQGLRVLSFRERPRVG